MLSLFAGALCLYSFHNRYASRRNRMLIGHSWQTSCCTQDMTLHAVGWGEGPWALVTPVKEGFIKTRMVYWVNEQAISSSYEWFNQIISKWSVWTGLSIKNMRMCFCEGEKNWTNLILPLFLISLKSINNKVTGSKLVQCIPGHV